MDNQNYVNNIEGIFTCTDSNSHRNDEYDENDFSVLKEMQVNHFWYKGRHLFLTKILKKFVDYKNQSKAIDLGGGVGGWVRFLESDKKRFFSHISLADSSLIALNSAKTFISKDVVRYKIDLLDLRMDQIWDVAFMLDVIEHIPNDRAALEQAYKSLKPGGYLIVTAPALMCFWSYNDVVAKHLRRYNKGQLVEVSESVGFKVVDVRYFMFFLSPLYYLTRKNWKVNKLVEEDKVRFMRKQHEVPNCILNFIMYTLFKFESFIPLALKFPWGTSIVAVLKK